MVNFAAARINSGLAQQPISTKIDHPWTRQAQEKIFQENLTKIEKVAGMTQHMLREHPNSRLLLKFDEAIRHNRAQIEWIRSNWRAAPELARLPLLNLAQDTINKLRFELKLHRNSGAGPAMEEILGPTHRLEGK